MTESSIGENTVEPRPKVLRWVKRRLFCARPKNVNDAVALAEEEQEVVAALAEEEQEVAADLEDAGEVDLDAEEALVVVDAALVDAALRLSLGALDEVVALEALHPLVTALQVNTVRRDEVSLYFHKP